MNIVLMVMVLLFAACGGDVQQSESSAHEPVSHGQQWDSCEPTRGCFAGSGLSCLEQVCTFECVDRSKVEQCDSVGGECVDGVCVQP